MIVSRWFPSANETRQKPAGSFWEDFPPLWEREREQASTWEQVRAERKRERNVRRSNYLCLLLPPPTPHLPSLAIALEAPKLCRHLPRMKGSQKMGETWPEHHLPGELGNPRKLLLWHILSCTFCLFCFYWNQKYHCWYKKKPFRDQSKVEIFKCLYFKTLCGKLLNVYEA